MSGLPSSPRESLLARLSRIPGPIARCIQHHLLQRSDNRGLKIVRFRRFRCGANARRLYPHRTTAISSTPPPRCGRNRSNRSTTQSAIRFRNQDSKDDLLSQSLKPSSPTHGEMDSSCTSIALNGSLRSSFARQSSFDEHELCHLRPECKTGISCLATNELRILSDPGHLQPHR